VAVRDSERDLIAAVDRHHEEWEKTIAASVDKTRKAFADALDTVAASHADYQEALAHRGWLAGFPDRSRYKSHGHAASLPGLSKPSGDPYPVVDVLSALRAVTEPPKPKFPQMPRPQPLTPREGGNVPKVA
jgi:hypothetical protein